MIIREGNTRDFLADLSHQIIDDAIEEIWIRHTSLSDPIVLAKPVGIPPFHPHTVLSVV